MKHPFMLLFEHDHANDDTLMQRLAAAGCADAFVGLGQPGLVCLEFEREGPDVEPAMLPVLDAVVKALPDAKLLSVGPVLTRPPVVVSDPEIMGGTPCLAGSRLPASTLLAMVDAGNSWERIVDSWPWLTLQHVEAARQWFAAN